MMGYSLNSPGPQPEMNDPPWISGYGQQHLGLSEAEFLALACGRHTRRLKPDWLSLYYRLRMMGGLRSSMLNAAVELELPWEVM